jgi:hypothetical protein
MLLDGSDDSQFLGDSKLIPATVNFSAKAKEERKQRLIMSLEYMFFIGLEFVFLGMRVNG